MGGGTIGFPGGWLATQVADQSASVKLCARLCVCGLAVLLWLAFAAEARAQEASPSGDTGTSVGAVADPGVEAAVPAGETTVGEAAPGELPADPGAPAEQPAPQAPAAETTPPAEPAAETPPPAVDPTPPPAVDPEPASPVAEPPPVVVEAPAVIVTPPSPLSDVDPGPLATDSQPDSIVVLPKPFEPGVQTLFPSGPGDRLAAVLTPAGSLFEKQIGPQSQSKDEPTRETGRAGDAPLLPPAPPKPGVPPRLYLGAGATGGSSGGFSALMVALVAAFIVAAAQSLGGLLPITLFSPRCTRLAVCLERPD
jgi:hypothetical protein